MAKPTTERLKKVVLLKYMCKDVVFMAQRPYFYFPIHVKIYSLIIHSLDQSPPGNQTPKPTDE